MTKIYFATDHAGFELKEKLVPFVRDELGYEIEDMGAHEYDSADDYPDFVSSAAQKVSEDPENTKAIVLGGSGQGEAMMANRFSGVRAAVYYGMPDKDQVDASGEVLDIVSSTRMHNNANVLSLGARFITEETAKEAVKMWLETAFSADERHQRRIEQLG